MSQLNGNRVLVIDDDPDLLQLVKLVFSRAGGQVSIADTLQDAVGIIATISQTVTPMNEIQERVGNGCFVLLAGSQPDLYRLSVECHNGMNLCRESASRPTNGIHCWPTMTAGSILMSTDHRPI